LYQTINPKGTAVWHNIGNCWYALHNYVQALIAFKRAEQYASFKECSVLQKNITAIQDKFNYSTEDNLWNRWRYIRWVTFGIPLLFLQLLVLLFWFGLFWHNRKRKHFIISILFGCCVGLLSLATIIQYQFRTQHFGIVLAQTTPDKQFNQIGKLCVAQEVRINDERKNWYKVQHQKITGWVWADAIEKI